MPDDLVSSPSGVVKCQPLLKYLTEQEIQQLVLDVDDVPGDTSLLDILKTSTVTNYVCTAWLHNLPSLDTLASILHGKVTRLNFPSCVSKHFFYITNEQSHRLVCPICSVIEKEN